MHYEEYKRMVQQMNLDDIRDDEELKTATLFLTDVGTLLHYDDCSNHLNKLYFIDPQWLCKMMAKVVTVKERNPFLKNGILHFDKIPQLFKDNEFPKQYFNEYMALLYHLKSFFPLINMCSHYINASQQTVHCMLTLSMNRKPHFTHVISFLAQPKLLDFGAGSYPESCTPYQEYPIVWIKIFSTEILLSP